MEVGGGGGGGLGGGGGSETPGVGMQRDWCGGGRWRWAVGGGAWRRRGVIRDTRSRNAERLVWRWAVGWGGGLEEEGGGNQRHQG